MRRIIFVTLALFIVLAFGQDTAGQVYRYTDKEGNAVFTDSPSKADGQKDSTKIWDGSFSKSSGPEEEICYYPEPIGVSHGTSVSAYGVASSGSGYSYDYREMQSYHDCIKRGGKRMPHPKDAAGYTERGLHYDRLGDYQQAIRDYNKAIELEPRDAIAYSYRGIVYAKLEDHQQAIRDYNRAIELKPDFAVVYVGRGVAYGWLTDYRQAIRDFSKAIELKPDYAAAYTCRAATYLLLGDHSQGINNYKMAARLGDKGAQDLLRSQGIGW